MACMQVSCAYFFAQIILEAASLKKIIKILSICFFIGFTRSHMFSYPHYPGKFFPDGKIYRGKPKNWRGRLSVKVTVRDPVSRKSTFPDVTPTQNSSWRELLTVTVMDSFFRRKYSHQEKYFLLGTQTVRVR